MCTVLPSEYKLLPLQANISFLKIKTMNKLWNVLCSQNKQPDLIMGVFHIFAFAA